MDDIYEILAKNLSLSADVIKAMVFSSGQKYRRFKVKKSSGGYRTILQPSVELKPILYWLKINLFDKLPVHKISTAFDRGNSIVNNAQVHKKSLYSVRIDVEDFFNSICPDDLFSVIENNKNNFPEWMCGKDFFELISRCCFISKKHLPIGYLTSPRIANVVMFGIDSELSDCFLNENRFGLAKVTRYADDFVFSTDKKGACKEAFLEFERVFGKTQYPSLRINKKKTTYMSRQGGSSMVTGLRINNDGVVIVHSKYKNHVRLLLKLFKENRLIGEDKEKLIGHLAHIQNADPGLFTKLSIKYYQEINRLRNRQ